MPSVRSGKLRHRVTIETPVGIQDPVTGAETIEWQKVATVWASVEPLSVREFIQSQSTQSELSARIEMRYRADLKPYMRFTHKGEIYNPGGMLPDAVSGTEHITIPVKQGVNDGD